MGHSFKKIDSEVLNFNIKTTYTTPSTVAEYAGFTDTPRGNFQGQDPQFDQKGIKQLNANAVVIAGRGEARSLSELKKGISPKIPNGKKDVVEHRVENDRSACVSFTFKPQTAAAFGYFSAQNRSYGKSENQRIGKFTLLAVRLTGNQYDVAGPTRSGETYAEEKEATVAGPVSFDDVLGYRKCVAIPKNQTARCSNIYIRNGLPKADESRAIAFLRAENPKKAIKPSYVIPSFFNLINSQKTIMKSPSILFRAPLGFKTPAMVMIENMLKKKNNG